MRIYKVYTIKDGIKMYYCGIKKRKAIFKWFFDSEQPPKIYKTLKGAEKKIVRLKTLFNVNCHIEEFYLN